MKKILILVVCVWLVGNGIAFANPNKVSTDVEKFIGTWVYDDESTGTTSTRGITKIVIWVESNAIFVRMWGSCVPKDCDWGAETTTIADAEDNQLSLEWNHGFVVSTQVISYLSDGRLRLDMHSHYIDDSGRPDKDWADYFLKSEFESEGKAVDIIRFNPDNLKVVKEQSSWLLVGGDNHSIITFRNEESARQALRVIKYYGMDEHVYIGRMEYFLVNGSVLFQNLQEKIKESFV